MAALPYMKLYPGDFFDDPLVKAMPPETQGVYLLLLLRMWQNGGWISASDAVIARQLGMHVNAWKQRHKGWITPALTPGVTPMVTGGVTYTQRRLVTEMVKALDLREKRIANLPGSERAKPAKPAKRAPSPVKEKHAQPGSPNSEPKPEAKPQPQAGDNTIAREESSALQAESFLHAGPVQVTALPPRPSLGLGGRSVADEPLDAEPNDTLRKRLVADGLKRPSLSDIANLGRKS